MRLTRLHIANLRAIRVLELEALPNAIVLAGPNGCGKSTVLDAIRLLKSAYGQYHENEWQSWFNEFQINIQHLSREAHRVLQDPARPLLVAADFMLSTREKDYLSSRGKELTEQLVWTRTVGGPTAAPDDKPIIAPTERRIYGDTVRQAAAEMLQELHRELELPALRAELSMDHTGDVQVTESVALEILFSVYAPHDLGVIDYHGANRSYGREQVGTVNLSVTKTSDRFRQSALYNTQNKYTNVKTEMASAYVTEIISREAGITPPPESDIVGTLKELFNVFFPGKKFLGPRPTRSGKLLFPVELENGTSHDIDELSSGEKEVLLGYLRLRNTAPQDSVILLDEPELHLNPRLIRGLPRFYQKHLGEALGNQIWMVTHSDTLLREAVEEPTFAVFHMQSATAVSEGENQAHPISAAAELDRAVIDLIGDLATYSPRARIVLLEGGGNSDVDLNILRQLFPEFIERVNAISSGSKQRVHDMHALLDRAAANGHFHARVFSIVDRDFDGPPTAAVTNRFYWDVYHIENYLIHAGYIRQVIQGLELGGVAPSDEKIEAELLIAARHTVDGLVRESLERQVNHELVSSIRTRVDPSARGLPAALQEAAERSCQRISAALAGSVSLSALLEAETRLRADFDAALSSDLWKAKLRGRDILKQFVHRTGVGIPYERFRNLIISQMRLDSYKPAGMRRVVDAITSA